jgi:hypothetical protein
MKCSSICQVVHTNQATSARCGTLGKSGGGISLDMNDQDTHPYSRNRWLPWLLERGLCDPQTAAEYVGRKPLSPEAFAKAGQEYQRATANYAPPYRAGFTLRKPDERRLTGNLAYRLRTQYYLRPLCGRSQRLLERSG